MTEAMSLRRNRFGNDVYFFTPSLKHYETDELATPETARFVPISVTGADCSLMCDHCRAKILESMDHVKRPEDLLEMGRRLSERGVRGVLITGGSDPMGVVPLRPFADAMRKLKEDLGFTVIVHTGLIDEDDAKALAGAGVDAAMLDIIGSNETIKDVYHLDARVEDFEAALEHLTSHNVAVAPHVVIGIHYGTILGEWRALDLISRYPVASVVLVVLSPIPGTPMDGAPILAADDLKDLFTGARMRFPETPVLLGCARPEGKEKFGIDAAALEAGLNGIAFPAEGIVSLARELDLKPVFSDDCCALVFREL